MEIKELYRNLYRLSKQIPSSPDRLSDDTFWKETMDECRKLSENEDTEESEFTNRLLIAYLELCEEMLKANRIYNVKEIFVDSYNLIHCISEDDKQMNDDEFDEYIKAHQDGFSKRAALEALKIKNKKKEESFKKKHGI